MRLRRDVLRALAALAAGPSARAQGSGPPVDARDHGAAGDGRSDDSGALERALEHARQLGGELRLGPGVYAISRYLRVRHGVRAIVGAGGVLRCIGPRPNVGLLLSGRSEGEPENVRGLRIEGLVVDAEGREAPVNAIHALNCSGCQFVGNHILSMRSGTGILVQSVAAGGEAAAGNLIANNRIEGVTGASGLEWWGIRVQALPRFDEGIDSQDRQWRARHVAADAELPARDHTLRGNHIVGGYYGIGLTAVRGSVVEDNVLLEQVRNLSAQDCCVGNVISGNRCEGALSSAIHLAYGSRGQQVRRNLVHSMRAQGEALLQAYVGVTDNEFVANEVRSGGSPQYLAYCAIHAEGNVFADNRLQGSARRAGIGVESNWDWLSTEPAHYGFMKGPGVRGFAVAASRGNRLLGNILEGAGEIPALLLGQWGGGDTSLVDTELAGNRVSGAQYTAQLLLTEAKAGALRGLRLVGNRFAEGAAAAQFVLPRGLAHLTLARDNAAFDRLVGTVDRNT